MSLKAEILARFSGGASTSPLFLPDLTLWYDWHRSRGTLPDEWRDHSLPQVARALGVPVWWVARPWRVETPGVEVITEQEGETRTVRTETPAGTLVARWKLMGPNGDWWQTEYPVKTREDLGAALELVRSKSYVLDTGQLAHMESLVGDEGVLALEIPRRPYSDVLHELLGWSEGLLLLGDAAVEEIIHILEDRLQDLVRRVAELPGDIVLAPDNLDGQFIPPPVFKAHLADSYQVTARALHREGKSLLVHVGGPIRHLLTALAESGVDGVEGISGPPQGDVTLAQARDIAGADLTLWGGIPQDFLHDLHTRDEFEAAVVSAAGEATGDSRMILGVADCVPVDADLTRLRDIPALLKRG
ncbi:MAG: hypothetical protein Kow0063_32780 [Anaerolineae bacterium]